GKTQRAKERYEAKLTGRRRDEAEDEAKRTARQEQGRKSSQIKELFKQAEDMFVSERYDEAESAVRSILSVDPDNGEAKIMLDTVDRARSRLAFLELSEKRAREYREHWKQTQEATRIQGETETIVYPDDWKDLTFRRERLLDELQPEASAVDQAVRDKLRRPVTFGFTDSPLEDVVDFMRQVGDLNIVVDTRVLAAAGAGGYRVTLSLTEVPMEDALDFILDLVDL
ncbi:unnamed protein product, partial [marine sediment metagenome]